MIEPVHWGARLTLVGDARYTEVAGTAVALSASVGEVVQLTGEMASLAMHLDGRPLTEALANELSGWGPDDRRRVIDVLRRLKTLGLLMDVPAGTRPESVDWLHPPALADTVSVAGYLRASDHGSDHAFSLVLDSHPDTTLRDGGERGHASDTEGGAARLVRLSLPVSETGSEVVTASDGPTLAAVIVDRVLVSADVGSRLLLGRASPGPEATPSALDAFVALIRAVRPQASLAQPGVVDLLACIAESVAVVWPESSGR